jgi:hypothetical protein
VTMIVSSGVFVFCAPNTVDDTAANERKTILRNGMDSPNNLAAKLT